MAMKRLHGSERLIDPRSPDRRPRRAAYALPTLFTAGNMFLGFYALMGSFQGAMDMQRPAAGAARIIFAVAAMAIGVAVFLDGLDGRIARMTNTVSDFGREMDSLADVISFGIAPAVLAFAWGVQFIGAAARSDDPRTPAPRRLFLRVPISAVRRGAPGPLQHPEQSGAQESRARRIASTSSACRFPPRPRWWPASCTRPAAARL